MKKINNIKKLTKQQQLILDSNSFTNSLSPKMSFDEQVVYQYSNDQYDLKLFNKIYGDVFYGKLDDKQNAILPFGGSLKQVLNISNSVYCLNFVADAYSNLNKSWKKLINSKIVTEDDIFSYTPISGFIDFESSYKEKINSYYSQFKQFLKENKYFEQIYDFKSFLFVFSKFISLATPFLPFSPSGFLLSRYCPTEVSGLVLTMKDIDSSKYSSCQEILNHPNFNLFNQLARQNSFIIDKNNPTKLYFNIYSPVSKSFIEIYQPDPKKYYDSFFVNISQYDIFFIINSLIDYYNKIVEENPKIVHKKYISCNSKIKLETVVKIRESISQDKKRDMLTQMNSINWWRIYLFIKGCENNANWNQKAFDELVRTCIKIQKTLDIDSALSYSSKILADLPISKDKIRNFSY